MSNIAICDDDKSICSQIETIILLYEKTYGTKIDIQVYYSGEDLLSDLEQNIEIDLLFLDIELLSLSGIDIGNKIRKEHNNHSMQIVYISGNEKYAMNLFKIHPLNFLIKPFQKEDVFNCIELGIHLLNKVTGYFSYKSGFDNKKIPIKNIIYFESSNRKITIHTIHGEDSFYGKLDEIYDKVKEYQFLYIHKSYLVNYFSIAQFNYNTVTLENGITLTISQARRKEIRKLMSMLLQEENSNVIT